MSTPTEYEEHVIYCDECRRSVGVNTFWVKVDGRMVEAGGRIAELEKNAEVDNRVIHELREERDREEAARCSAVERAERAEATDERLERLAVEFTQVARIEEARDYSRTAQALRHCARRLREEASAPADPNPEALGVCTDTASAEGEPEVRDGVASRSVYRKSMLY